MSPRIRGVLVLYSVLCLAGCGLLNDSKTDSEKRDSADRTREISARRKKACLQAGGPIVGRRLTCRAILRNVWGRTPISMATSDPRT